jgi:DNA-binding transcriptional LysR family regulator
VAPGEAVGAGSRVTLASKRAIRESVQVGLGIALISCDAVVRELDEGALEEWRCADLPSEGAWHVVARPTSTCQRRPGCF